MVLPASWQKAASIAAACLASHSVPRRVGAQRRSHRSCWLQTKMVPMEPADAARWFCGVSWAVTADPIDAVQVLSRGSVPIKPTSVERL